MKNERRTDNCTLLIVSICSIRFQGVLTQALEPNSNTRSRLANLLHTTLVILAMADNVAILTQMMAELYISPPSPFLALPYEIRAEILYYTFKHPYPPTPTRPTITKVRKNFIPWQDLHRIQQRGWWGSREMTYILLINRQMHNEAEKVLFKHFIFLVRPQMQSMKAMQKFMSARLSIPARSFITRLRIIWQFRAIGFIDAELSKVYRLLVIELPNLKAVAVAVRISTPQNENLFGYNRLSGFNIGDMEKLIVIRMMIVLEPFKQLEHLDVSCSEASPMRSAVQDCRRRIKAGNWWPEIRRSQR